MHPIGVKIAVLCIGDVDGIVHYGMFVRCQCCYMIV